MKKNNNRDNGTNPGIMNAISLLGEERMKVLAMYMFHPSITRIEDAAGLINQLGAVHEETISPGNAKKAAQELFREGLLYRKGDGYVLGAPIPVEFWKNVDPRAFRVSISRRVAIGCGNDIRVWAESVGLDALELFRMEDMLCDLTGKYISLRNEEPEHWNVSPSERAEIAARALEHIAIHSMEGDNAVETLLNDRRERLAPPDPYGKCIKNVEEETVRQVLDSRGKISRLREQLSRGDRRYVRSAPKEQRKNWEEEVVGMQSTFFADAEGFKGRTYFENVLCVSYDEGELHLNFHADEKIIEEAYGRLCEAYSWDYMLIKNSSPHKFRNEETCDFPEPADRLLLTHCFYCNPVKAKAAMEKVEAFRKFIKVETDAIPTIKVRRPAKIRIFAEKRDVSWFDIGGEIEVSNGRVVKLMEILRKRPLCGKYIPLGDGEYLRITAKIRMRLEALGIAGHDNGDLLAVPRTSIPMLDKAFSDSLEEYRFEKVTMSMILDYLKEHPSLRNAGLEIQKYPSQRALFGRHFAREIPMFDRTAFRKYYEEENDRTEETLDLVDEDECEFELPETLKLTAGEIRRAFETPVALPEGLNAELRPYQLEGFRWLSRLASCSLGACLADDMGLGKTVQTIALLLSRAKDGPSLVVAPKSVCGNWSREIRRFAPSLRVIMAAEAKGGSVKNAGPGDVVVTGYVHLATRSGAFLDKEWNGIVLDEAQFIKNPSAKRTVAARALRGKFRVACTGTPVENRMNDLWSIFSFLNPGLLGTEKTFEKKYLTEDGYATKGLQKLVMPLILRRVKKDVLKELPPKTEVIVPVELGTAEREAYEACRRMAKEAISGENGDKRFRVLAELTRLRRFCCNPRLVIPEFAESAKFKALEELMSEFEKAGQRTLIFSQYTDCLNLVREVAKRNVWRYVHITGESSTHKREKAIKEFKWKRVPFFLISLKAGGTGLNLAEAENVIILDPWWNPAVEDQASDRAHRIGQKKPVTVYRLVTQDTVEERVVELHARKRTISKDILDGKDSAAISEEELLGLLE